MKAGRGWMKQTMPSMPNKQPLVSTGTALEAPFCRGNPATALLRECETMAVTNKHLWMAFKRGLSRRQVARKYRVSIKRVDTALCEAIRAAE